MSANVEPTPLPRQTDQFSLVSGGLLNAVLTRMHLLRPPVDLLRERTLALCAIIWLPLFLLTLTNGTAWGTKVQVPFLYDVFTHARFLIAVPLLFLADRFAYTRMPAVIRQFTRRGIVAESESAEFQAILDRASKLTQSFIPEVVCLLLAWTAGDVVWKHVFSLQVTTWYARPDTGSPTPAGLWFEWISLPLFRFLFFRWFYRLGVWAFALYRISRLPLHLLPSHPDRAGGLGFLNQVTAFFMPVISALGVLLAGQVSGKILLEGLDPKSFEFEGVGVLLIALVCVLGPLLWFTPTLVRTRRAGLGEFGALGARYTREFEEKWIEGKARGEPLVGSSDIQSLADLANSYEVVRKMSWTVIDRSAVMQVIGGVALPCLPLVMVFLPLEQLLRQLLKLVL